MQKEVILFEDERSLFSGDLGLDLIEEIIRNSSKILNEGGFVVLEVDEFHTKELVCLLIKNKFIRFHFEKDIYGKERFLIFRLS